MVHRAGHLHDEVVLARVAVLLVGALGRETRRGALVVQALDVAIVDDGRRVATERVGRAVHAARQAQAELGLVGDGLDRRLAGEVAAEAVLGDRHRLPVLRAERRGDDERCRNQWNQAHGFPRFHRLGSTRMLPPARLEGNRRGSRSGPQKAKRGALDPERTAWRSSRLKPTRLQRASRNGRGGKYRWAPCAGRTPLPACRSAEAR